MPALILPNIYYQVIDFRVKPHKDIRGRDMFMTCFSATGLFLVGLMERNKLWRVRPTEKRTRVPYKKNWPWSNPTAAFRSCMEFCWMPRFSSIHQWDSSCDLREHLGKCVLFEKRGKNHYNDIYTGFIEDMTFLLIRLQRWSKRMVWTRRRLALCMGMHSRLGDKSLLASLGGDVIQLLMCHDHHVKCMKRCV